MREEDYVAILEHLRRQMRANGLGDVDARLVSEVSAAAEQALPASLLLFDYLERLDTAMTLDAADTGGKILRSLNDVAVTERGQPIKGIELELTDADRALYATDAETIDLIALRDLNDLIDRLRLLRDDLIRQSDRPE